MSQGGRSSVCARVGSVFSSNSVPEIRNRWFASSFGPMTGARLAFGIPHPCVAGSRRFARSFAFRERPQSSRSSYDRFWPTGSLWPMVYFSTSVTTRFEERLRFLGRGTATEAMYSLTLRRTSRIRSASDFAGRATLTILQAIGCLLNKATPRRSLGSWWRALGKPLAVATHGHRG